MPRRVNLSLEHHRAQVALEHSWFLWGGRGTPEGGWGSGSTGSMKGVSSAGCQELYLEGALKGRSSLDVSEISAGMVERPRIRGPWTFEFDVSSP
jgi:hypothetical protein